MTAPKLRYRGLDLLRGVAAFGILEQHLEHVMGWNVLNRAYLAVDLFFMLSGFVIAYSYEGKLLGGMSRADFFRQRVIRLYPLAIIGTLLGSAVAAYQLDLVHVADQRSAWVGATLFGVLLLPSPYLRSFGLNSPFPLNIPLWSLFWEVVASFAYGALFRRAGSKPLVVTAALCAVVLFVRCFSGGNFDSAWAAPVFWLGPFKLIFSFSVGLLLFRAHQSVGGLSFRVPPALLAAAFLGVTAIPKPESGDGLIDYAIVLGVFPFMVFLAADAYAPGVETGFAEWAGRLSFPVYALQYPFRNVIHAWAEARPEQGTALGDGLRIAAADIGIIAFAAAVAAYIDEPLRRWLVRRTRPPEVVAKQ